MTFVLFKGRMHMKKSLYIYNCGDLKRKDNTLRFTTYDDEKRDVPIERISDIYVMSELSFLYRKLLSKRKFIIWRIISKTSGTLHR